MFPDVTCISERGRITLRVSKPFKPAWHNHSTRLPTAKFDRFSFSPSCYTTGFSALLPGVSDIYPNYISPFPHWKPHHLLSSAVFTTEFYLESRSLSNLTILKSYSTSNRYYNEKLRKPAIAQNILRSLSIFEGFCGNSSGGEGSTANSDARLRSTRSCFAPVTSNSNRFGLTSPSAPPGSRGPVPAHPGVAPGRGTHLARSPPGLPARGSARRTAGHGAGAGSARDGGRGPARPAPSSARCQEGVWTRSPGPRRQVRAGSAARGRGRT